jgi:Fur family ferric uptake transcriptional regulator
MTAEPGRTRVRIFVWSLGGGLPGLQKQLNLRMTRQREVILEELRKVNTHPSADEVYEMVRKRLPRISLGTVYRNLEILSESGDIQKLEPGCTLKRFDGNPSKHWHIRCIRCDRIADVPIVPGFEIDLKQANATDFKVIGHRLEFLGVCPQCLAKSNPANEQRPQKN